MRNSAPFMILFLLIGMFSCRKSEVIVDPEEPAYTGLTKAEKIDSIKKELLAQGEKIASIQVDADSSKVDFTLYSDIHGAAQYAVFEPGTSSDLKTYPWHYVGNIIDGKSFLSEGALESPYIRSTQDPAQKILIEGKDNKIIGSQVLESLKNSDVAAFHAQAINKLDDSEINQYKWEPEITISSYKNYQDIKDSVLFTAQSLTTNLIPQEPNFEFTSDSDPIEQATGVYVFFKQVYYKMKIDTTAANWHLLKDDFADSVYRKTDPVVMNEISYGRYGLLSLESHISKTEIESILKLAMDDFDKLSPSQREILTDASVRCTFFGLADEWRINPLTQTSLGRVQLFSEILNDDDYRKRSTGNAPIQYKLATVQGNQPYASSQIKKTIQFDL